MAVRYKRILLKLSGESLMGDKEFGLAPDMLQHYAEEIKSIIKQGVEIAVVIGGGNIFRGLQASESNIDRVQGDYMGMMATIINGLALQSALEKNGIFTRLMTSIAMDKIAEPYIRRRAIRHLEKGRVVILAAGTGNPYFTTDSAAALRASEINADVILKGTRVDGVYTADPEKDATATKYDNVSFPYQAPLLDRMSKSTPKSMISPLLEMPSPYMMSNSAIRNGGANLFLTTLTLT